MSLESGAFFTSGPEKQCSCAQCGRLCTSRISLFAGLDEAAQEDLVRLAQHRDFRRGETVFRSEDSAGSILILRFGRVKLSRLTPEGQEFVLDILAPGDVLGEQTLFGAEPRGVDGTALEDCGVCLISAPAIADLVMRRPDMGVRLLHSVGRKLHDMQRLAEILSRRHAKARLAGFLLLRADRAGEEEVRLSHEDIAASLSLSRETVTRKLAELERAGMVRLPGYRRILLRDRHALQAACLADRE